MCSSGKSGLVIDDISKTRTLLRCYLCRIVMGYWDYETAEQQEERIRKYNERNGNSVVWTQEQLDALHKPAKPKKNPMKRRWSKKELEELV